MARSREGAAKVLDENVSNTCADLRSVHARSTPTRVARFLIALLACCGIALLGSCSVLGPSAPVDIDAAIASTRGSERILVVDWGAPWCAPCRRMEETSWSDARVRSWVREHARLVHVDRDHEEARANRTLIRVLPTVIAYCDGAEFDRISGYHDATELLEWLEAIENGETSLALVARRAAREGWSLADANTHHRLAREFVRIGKLDDAVRAYVELWPKRHDASDPLAVRTPDEMRSLALQYEPARSAFTALRDALTSRVKHGTAGDVAASGAAIVTTDAALAARDLDDWLELSNVIDDRRAIVAWFERQHDLAPLADLLCAHRESLWRAIESEGQYASLVRFVEASVPVVRYAENRARITDFERHAFDGATLASMRHERTREVAQLWAGCVSLARTADAERIERALLAEDDSADARAALVEARRALRP